MSHGYYVHRRARSRYHYGVLYTEARLGYLIAIGKGDVPEDAWFSMVRTYPPDCEGQTETPLDVDDEAGARARGHRGALRVGRHRVRAVVGRQHVRGPHADARPRRGRVTRRRASAPTTSRTRRCSGATRSSSSATRCGDSRRRATPDADGYGEYGVRVLGSAGYRAGAVTPHAAALALAVTPEPAIADLRRLAERYDLYGEYGFYDAVDPISGKVAPAYLALDQAMILIAAANHLKPHCIQERFASDPIVRKALPVIGAEDFFE